MNCVWMIETRTRGTTGPWMLYECTGYGTEDDAQSRARQLQEDDADNQYRAEKYVPMHGGH